MAAVTPCSGRSPAQDKTLDELINAPVAALAGVSENDAKLLRDAFQIVTVGDLGDNPYFRTAQALVALSIKTK